MSDHLPQASLRSVLGDRVLVVMLVAYPLSFGPARCIIDQRWCPMWGENAFFILYWLMLRLTEHAPEPIVEAIR